MPDSSGEYPWTNWKNCVIRKNIPNVHRKIVVIAPLPVENGRTLNSRGSSIGFEIESSYRTKSAPPTTNAAKPASVAGDVHPSSGPSITANTSPTSATTESTAPIGSSAVWPGSRDVGTNSTVSTISSTTMGMQTMKTEPHQ